MARTPRKPATFNRTQETFFRQNFLQTINARCPEVMERLHEEISQLRTFGPDSRERTLGWEPDEVRFMHVDKLADLAQPIVKAWAVEFNVSDTWVEDQCHEIALSWLIHPDRYSLSYLPLAVSGPVLDSAHELVIRIPIPYELRLERAYFRWDSLRDYLRGQLEPSFERELADLQQSGLEAGVINESKIPEELDNKMAVTALYLFRNLSPEQIATEPGLARERSVLNRWINEVTEFLDLDVVRERRLVTRTRAVA